MKGEKVDLIVHNAKIHTMDLSGTIHEAIAIRDGKIVEVGPERQILNKYRSDETIDAQGKEMYPGLTDAHGHMLMYAKQLLGVDLRGVRSEQEMIHKCEQYKAQHPGLKFLVGRGWDQTTWAGQDFPTNEKLNEVFPDIPVCLYRVDGHAALINDFLINKSKLRDKIPMLTGGEVLMLQTYRPSGLIVDNAMNLVQPFIPDYSRAQYFKALLQVQEELFQYGITGVHEAGIDFEHIGWFRSLIKSGKLKLNVYAMLMDSSKPALCTAKRTLQFQKPIHSQFQVLCRWCARIEGRFAQNALPRSSRK